MITTPYLIQRAEIKTPLAGDDARLSEAVSFHYMGSAEFEFGALPKSFRRIEALSDGWKCRLVEEIKEDDTPLRVWSALTDEEFEQYKKFLLQLRDPKNNGGHLRTKEGVRFEHDRKHSEFSCTNFWWDISNNVMFGFKKEFMKRVGTYVANSLVYMNAAHTHHEAERYSIRK
jgi:hypothetical protein